MTQNNTTTHRYLLDISYIGKGFNGFQSQADGSGVQDRLEKALSILLREPIKIRGASRTDSGVHAFSQKATFSSKKILEPKKFLRGANALLGAEVSLSKVEEVSKDFNPIVQAKAKIYRYSLWFGHCYSPFLAPFVWQIPARVDKKQLEEELKLFEGTHDFSSFCNSDSSAKTKTRTILQTHISFYEDSCDIWILGEGFLKQMIRILVGTLVDRGLGKRDLKTIPELLNLKDRTCAGQTAPAEGLSLVEIFYENTPELLSYIKEKQERAFFYR